MNSGLAILCFGAVTFLLWVLTGLVKEVIVAARRTARSQEMVLYPMRKEQRLVIPIDSHRRILSSAVAATVSQHHAAFASVDEDASATGTK